MRIPDLNDALGTKSLVRKLLDRMLNSVDEDGTELLTKLDLKLFDFYHPLSFLILGIVLDF